MMLCPVCQEATRIPSAEGARYRRVDVARACERATDEEHRTFIERNAGATLVPEDPPGGWTSAALDARFHELIRTVGKRTTARVRAMAAAASSASDGQGEAEDEELALAIGGMAGALEIALTDDFAKRTGRDIEECRTLVRGLIDRSVGSMRRSVDAEHDDAMREVRSALEAARR